MAIVFHSQLTSLGPAREKVTVAAGRRLYSVNNLITANNCFRAFRNRFYQFPLSRMLFATEVFFFALCHPVIFIGNMAKNVVQSGRCFLEHVPSVTFNIAHCVVAINTGPKNPFRKLNNQLSMIFLVAGNRDGTVKCNRQYGKCGCHKLRSFSKRQKLATNSPEIEPLTGQSTQVLHQPGTSKGRFQIGFFSLTNKEVFTDVGRRVCSMQCS